MFVEQNTPTRVGIRLVVVAALVGLVVLLLQGSAAAEEPAPFAAVAEALASREPMTPEERVAVAESKLGEERHERMLRGYSRLLEIGWQVLTQASPRRVLSETRDLARELWSWRKPYEAEGEAREWLEPAIAVSSENPELVKLYARMHAREVKAATESALEQAEAAASRGHFEHADARLRRVLELSPDSTRAREVAARLAELRAAPAPEAAPEAPLELVIADWEAPLSAALLAGHYDRALELGTDEPSAVLGRESGSYLLGDLEPAVRSFVLLS